MSNARTRNLVLSALFLALCLLLPFLTGQIPQIGQMLSPMHIPVFLCGFVCGWPYALAVGFVAPLLRNLLFHMPPLFPTGVSMAFELATYGVVAALMYRKLPGKPVLRIYGALLTSMVAGRIVWGLVRLAIAGLTASSFTFQAFLSGAVLTALPGIVCHLILVPLIVLALERAHLIGQARRSEH